MGTMDFTDIINIAVVLLSAIGGYVMYILQKKAKILDTIVSRLYAIEKEQAIIKANIDNIHESKRK